MYTVGVSYVFKIKIPESEKGFAYYTGKIEDIQESQIFIYTIKQENLSFSLSQIMRSKEI